MEKHRLVPLAMAIAGFAAIGVGVYQGLVHVAPGYEGTIMSGWDGSLSHEEVLLVQLGALGVGSVGAGLRWKRLSLLSSVMGSIVLFYAFWAVFTLFQSPRPLYREVSVQGAGFEGDTVMFVLGAEPRTNMTVSSRSRLGFSSGEVRSRHLDLRRYNDDRQSSLLLRKAVAIVCCIPPLYRSRRC